MPNLKTKQLCRYSIICIFLCLPHFSFSVNIELKYSIEGKGHTYAKSSTIDAQGNIIIIGNFTDTIDIDPGIGIYTLTKSSLSWGIFIAKLDSLGQFIWGKSIEGDANVYAACVKTDKNNNIFISGDFYFRADFDPGPNSYYLNSKGQSDAFLLKLSSKGDFVWANQFGGKSFDEASEIEIHRNEMIYMTGTFNDTIYNQITKAPIIISNGFSDVFFAKFNQNGSLLWSKSFGGKSADFGFGMAINSKGQVYLIGEYASTVDFDPGIPVDEHSSKNGPNTFISKFDSLGNYQKVITIKSEGIDHGNSITIDQHDDIIVCGTSFGMMEIGIDSLKYNFNGNGALVAKFDSSSQLVWVKIFGNSMMNVGNKIACDKNNDIYIIGVFEDTISLGSIQFYSEGQGDVFIAKLTSAGEVEWANSFGGNESDWGYSLTVIRPNNIVAIGQYSDVGYINNDKSNALVCNGQSAAFYFQIADRPLFIEKEFIRTNLGFYPNPATHKVNILLPQNYKVTKVIAINIIGQTYDLPSTESYAGNLEVDLSLLPKGFYTLLLDGTESNHKAQIKIIHD